MWLTLVTENRKKSWRTDAGAMKYLTDKQSVGCEGSQSRTENTNELTFYEQKARVALVWRQTSRPQLGHVYRLAIKQQAIVQVNT